MVYSEVCVNDKVDCEITLTLALTCEAIHAVSVSVSTPRLANKQISTLAITEESFRPVVYINDKFDCQTLTLAITGEAFRFISWSDQRKSLLSVLQTNKP